MILPAKALVAAALIPNAATKASVSQTKTCLLVAVSEELLLLVLVTLGALTTKEAALLLVTMPVSA